MVVVVVIENYKEMQIAMKVRVGTVAERKKEEKKGVCWGGRERMSRCNK